MGIIAQRSDGWGPRLARRFGRARAVWPILGLMFLSLGGLSARAQGWTLWSSPNGDTEVPDQQQPLWNSYGGIQNGHGIGQSFTPAQSPLARLDVLAGRHYDGRPFALRLWKWQDDYATTVSQAPLFQGTVTLPDHTEPVRLSFFPNLAVQTNALYYFEFNNGASNGEWVVYLVNDGTNHYDGGQLRINNWPRDTMDLYFRSYTSPQGPTNLPVFAGSNTNLPWSPPPAPGAAVTRADLYNLLAAWADYQSPYYVANVNPYCASHTIYEAFRYRATSNELYASKLIAIFENAYRYRQQNPVEYVGFTWLENPGFAYLWARNSPTLVATNHAHIKALLLDHARAFWPNRETGMMNRALGGALSYKLVTTLWNDMPEYADWNAYADGVWQEFLDHFDTDEDSTHYNWLSWRYILELLQLYGRDDLWQNPGFRALFDRFLRQATALGPPGTAGDSNGWGVGWCLPFWLFEQGAIRYQDPVCKWRAYRTFDYQRQHIKNIPLYQASYAELHALAFAYFDMDESLPTVCPAAEPLTHAASAVTYRREIVPRRISQWSDPPPAFSDFTTNLVPDTLILRGGFGVEDFSVVVNLIAGFYGHGHNEAGAVLALTDRGSLLYADGTYFNKQPEDHSLPLLRRYRGGVHTGTDDRVSVTHFREARAVTVARTRWNDRYGWNLQQERRFTFVKNRFLLVRDRLDATGGGQVSFGPVWHAQDVHPSHGQNWYAIYTREPPGINGWRFHNPERYALLWFVPRPGAEIAAWRQPYDAYPTNNPPPPPYVLYQRCTATYAAGDTQWADTLLRPFGPELSPAQAAATVTPLYNDGVGLALRVTVSNESWTVVDNPAGALLNAPGLCTDADYLVARVRLGEGSGYLLVKDATVARVGGIAEQWHAPTSEEFDAVAVGLYQAVSNTVTHQVAATLTAAVAAAAAGQTLEVYDGVYAENVTLDRDNLTVRAAPGTTPLLSQTTGSGAAIRVTATNVTVQGLEISGAGYASGIAYSGVGTRLVQNRIHHLWAGGGGANPAAVYGLRDEGTGCDHQLTSNVLYRLGTASSNQFEYGIYVLQGGGGPGAARVAFNTISNLGRGAVSAPATAVYGLHSPAASHTGTLLEGNRIADLNSGVVGGIVSAGSSNIVRHNEIVNYTGNGGSSLNACGISQNYSLAGGWQISGNRIEGGGQAGQNVQGIVVAGYGNLVHDNLVHNAGRFALYSDAVVPGNLFSHNLVIQDGSATGLRVVSGKNLVWRHNTIVHRANPLYASGGNPVYDFRNATNCLVSGNTLFTINGGVVGSGLFNLLAGNPAPAANRFAANFHAAGTSVESGGATAPTYTVGGAQPFTDSAAVAGHWAQKTLPANTAATLIGHPGDTNRLGQMTRLQVCTTNDPAAVEESVTALGAFLFDLRTNRHALANLAALRPPHQGLNRMLQTALLLEDGRCLTTVVLAYDRAELAVPGAAHALDLYRWNCADPTNQFWQLAVAGNAVNGFFPLNDVRRIVGPPDDVPGHYGVDPVNQVVWANVNVRGDFGAFGPVAVGSLLLLR